MSNPNLSPTRFYVYIYLDPRKPGSYKYGEFEFDHEPFYIGKGTQNRLHVHIKDALETQRQNYFLHKLRSILSKGLDPIRFKVKENMTNDESLNFERSIIQTIGRQNQKKGPLTNLVDGGYGNKDISEETRIKMSSWQIGRKFSNTSKAKMSIAQKGRITSEETKQKISLIQKGKIVSEKTKAKMSIAQKGRIVSKETGQKISLTKTGVKTGKASPEHCQKISNALKGHKISEETKAKISLALKRRREQKLLMQSSQKENLMGLNS